MVAAKIYKGRTRLILRCVYTDSLESTNEQLNNDKTEGW